MLGEGLPTTGNPLFTRDQREMEQLAQRIVALPELVPIRAQVRQRWQTIVGRDAPQEAWRRFDGFLDEWALNYALKAVNADANHPRVLTTIFGKAHEWGGAAVPGSRAGGGDNPDTTYALIPIDSQARFELRGQCSAIPPADVQLSLKGNLSQTMTIDNLDWADIEVEKDGSFVVSIGPQATGERNHLLTAPETRTLFIRDTRADWRQVPNAYTIRRLDPPSAPPLSEEQIATRAGRIMLDDIPAIYWWMRIMDGAPENDFMPPFNTGTFGGLVTQMMAFGRLKLDDDEALVVTSNDGGAAYHSIVLYDYWLCSLDAANQLCSFNNAQSVANADGSVTWVIAAHDPGVHNWLDTDGDRELRIMRRWQALPRERNDAAPPFIRAKRVKLRDIEYVLPPDMRRCDAAQRQLQLTERRSSFHSRFATQ